MVGVEEDEARLVVEDPPVVAVKDEAEVVVGVEEDRTELGFEAPDVVLNAPDLPAAPAVPAALMEPVLVDVAPVGLDVVDAVVIDLVPVPLDAVDAVVVDRVPVLLDVVDAVAVVVDAVSVEGEEALLAILGDDMVLDVEDTWALDAVDVSRTVDSVEAPMGAYPSESVAHGADDPAVASLERSMTLSHTLQLPPTVSNPSISFAGAAVGAEAEPVAEAKSLGTTSFHAILIVPFRPSNKLSICSPRLRFAGFAVGVHVALPNVPEVVDSLRFHVRVTLTVDPVNVWVLVTVDVTVDEV